MRRSTRVFLVLAFVCATKAWAQGQSHHEPAAVPRPSPLSLPESSYAAQMTQAMDRMHAAMAAAPRTGQPDRNFLAVMIPHHQGAIEMAKAVLLVTKDPRIRNLAQSIITEQQYEVELMQRLLAETPATISGEERP